MQVNALLQALAKAICENYSMKVLDLQCELHHVFEGWFASEDDFHAQLGQGLVQCPVCSSATISKKPSAPRLNLHTSRGELALHAEAEAPTVSQTSAPALDSSRLPQELMAAWVEVARKIVEHTTDVGDQFAQEARKIHYGEAEHRAIRGQTSVDEAHALLEEGIDVMPLPLPEFLKKPLQ